MLSSFLWEILFSGFQTVTCKIISRLKKKNCRIYNELPSIPCLGRKNILQALPLPKKGNYVVE